MAVSIHTPSSNINIVPINAIIYAQWLPQYIRPVAILVQSLEIQIHTLSGCLNTSEIEEHTYTPSSYINTAPINLTRMLSDNLNTCAINKYINISVTIAIW